MKLVDVQHLEEKIVASGKPKTFLARKVGCSREYFTAKCKGDRDFKLEEARILCDELGITSLKERDQIFFAKPRH